MPRWISFIFVNMMLLSSISFAGTPVNHFVSPHFTVALPPGMNVSWKDEDPKLKLYRYLFRGGNGYEHNMQEMRVVVGDIVPVNKAKFDAWQNDTLGTMIAIFADAHHVPLEANSDELNQKPAVLMFGHQRFKQISLQFGQLHAQFLTTTVGNLAYMYTLVNDQKDPVSQAQSFRAMHSAIKSASYR